MSNTLGLVDFAIGLVNSVLNLPYWQLIFGGNSNYRRTVINPAHQLFFRLDEMTFGLVHARYSLPQWEAVNWLSLYPAMPNLYMTVCFNSIILDLFLSSVIFFYEFVGGGGGREGYIRSVFHSKHCIRHSLTRLSFCN